MKLRLITVGTRMPGWVEQGTAEYLKRVGRELDFELVEVPLARRGKGADIQRCIDKEGEALLARLSGREYVVALDERGQSFSTAQLAERLQAFRLEGRDLGLLVGGPDGLSEACRQQADAVWSLSALTLPHPLVRIIVAEQCYRAMSLLQGHPYHRA